MCLLITKPAGVTFSEEFLRGVFRKNSDGIGIMYAEDNTIYIAKSLPKTYDDMKAYYDEHAAGRDCAVHWRMRTHGEIDLANCHPYEVLSKEDGYPLWLMHNGVLHTDNVQDKKFSDTWHYIRDYLRPILLKNPTWFMSPYFAELISEHIGSNRFTLLDAHGNMVTVNKQQGVEHEGAWLSNTYAWDTHGTAHAPKFGFYSRGSMYSNSFDDDYGDFGTEVRGVQTGPKPATDPTCDDRYQWCEETADLFAMLVDDIVESLESEMNDSFWDELQYEREVDELMSLIPAWLALMDYYDAVGKGNAWALFDALYDGTATYDEAAVLIGAKRALMFEPLLVEPALLS